MEPNSSVVKDINRLSYFVVTEPPAYDIIRLNRTSLCDGQILSSLRSIFFFIALPDNISIVVLFVEGHVGEELIDFVVRTAKTGRRIKIFLFGEAEDEDEEPSPLDIVLDLLVRIQLKLK